MNSISVSELRQKTAEIITDVTRQGTPITVMQRSHPKAVIVDHDYFTSLEEAVMDLQDALEAEKAKSEPTIPLKDYVAKRWPKK